MNRIITGRAIIAAAMVLGTIGSNIVDNMPGPNSHILAVTTWPPHALFHNAEMFLLLDGGVLIFTRLLFRRSREPEVAALGATLFVCAYWTPFLYITSLFPQASLVPTSPSASLTTSATSLFGTTQFAESRRSCTACPFTSTDWSGWAESSWR